MFEEEFLNRFLSESFKWAKSQAFENLWKTPEMSISEYTLVYTELAKYAKHMVPNERAKIQRYIYRLPRPYYLSLSPQARHFATLSEVADCARGMEARMELDKQMNPRGKQ